MRGQGRTFRRGNIWWIAYYHRGKEFRESTHSTKEPDANRLLRARTRTAGTPDFVDPKVEQVLFDDLGEGFLRDYRINGQRSLRDAERSVRQLGMFFTGVRAFDIDGEMIEAYKDQRLRDRGPTGRHIAPATVNRELAALRRMFSIARKTRRGFRLRPEITLLIEDNTREMFVTPPLWEALVREIRGRDEDVADGLDFLYESGWRRNEAFGLRWSDVEWHRPDRSKASVRLRRAQSKNKRERLLPLRGRLLQVVQRRWNLRYPGCPYVFHRKGRRIREFRMVWEEACLEVGLQPGRDGLTVHDLRRSGARNMRRAGLTEAESMQMTGHRTRAIFDRYNIVSEDDLGDAVERATAFTARERQKQPNVTKLRQSSTEHGQNTDNGPASEPRPDRRRKASG